MNADTLPYPHSKHLTIAGCLTLVTLATAIIYAFHSSPYTMVIFLGGGSPLLAVAVVLFLWAIWKDVRARLESVTTRQFGPGEIIFRQGDVAEQVFVVSKGQVEAVREDPAKGDVVVWRLGEGEFFGETAILSRQARYLTVRAIDNVELLAIHRTDFLRFYATLPQLRSRIAQQQAQRKALASKAGAVNPAK
jgi:hypothetical protein